MELSLRSKAGKAAPFISHKSNRRATWILFMLPALLVYTIFMALLLGALAMFWFVPAGQALVAAAALAWTGFLVYGPQILTSVHSADIAGKHAAATATGFVGLMGYMGSLLSGTGTGWIVDHFGWNGGFTLFLVCAFLGIFFFALTWRVPKKCRE